MKMQRNMKRVAGLLLAVVVFALTLTASLSTRAYDPILLEVTDGLNLVGRDVTVNLEISANSGLAAADIDLVYDATKLTFVSAAAGEATAGGMYQMNGNTAGRVRLSFIHPNGITAGGALMEVTFTIRLDSGMALGDSTPLTIDQTTAQLHDIDFEPLAFTPGQGTVTIGQDQQTIRFYSNGGTPVATMSAVPGTTMYKPGDPTRTGYVFNGWYKDIALVTAVAWPYVMTEENVRFYAKWTANTYQVKYNPNSTIGVTGTMANSSHTYDVEKNLTANNFAKVGHTFTGWSTTAGGTAQYNDAQAVLNLSANPGAIVNFYAVWALNDYTINFDSAGGSAVASITQGYNTNITAPANPLKAGYTFTAWDPALPSKMPVGGLSCTAQWTIAQFTMTFKSNGGSAVAPITQDYNTAVTPPVQPERAGFFFLGWLPDLPTHMPAQNTVYQAKWAPSTITVIKEWNGGTPNSATSFTRYPNNPQAIPLTPPVHPGGLLVFAGWWEDETMIFTPVVAPYYPTDNVTLYAKWITPDPVAFTFDADGGIGGGIFELVPNTPMIAPTVTKEGKIFAGWTPALPVKVPLEAQTYTAQWIDPGDEVTITKVENNLMTVNIKGWTSDTQYQIWSYQTITSDTELDGVANVKTEQWILSQAYKAGSAGDVQEDGSTNFVIPAFDSPDNNYTIAVRVADTDYTFLREVRDAYTKDDVNEVVITKVLVDGTFAKEPEIKEIEGGEVLMSVLTNKAIDVAFSATVAEATTQPVGTGPGTFTWDISGLSDGTYTVVFTADNGATQDTKEVEFRLYSSDTSIVYGQIDSMTLKADGTQVTIDAETVNGQFWYSIGERGREATLSDLFEYAMGIKHEVTGPGVYQVSGFINRTGETRIGGFHDDAFIRSIEVLRPGPVVPDPEYVTVTFYGGGGVPAGPVSTQQTVGKPFDLPAFTKAGYVLTGWTPELPAVVTNTPGQSYTAVWATEPVLPDPVKITFINFAATHPYIAEDNGEIVTVETYQIPGQPLVPEPFVNVDYELTGWTPELPALVPAEAKTYTGVWKVKEAVEPEEPTGPVYKSTVTLTADKDLANVTKGTKVTFTADADILNITDGEAVQYSFWRQDAKGLVLVKDWSASNTLTWTPARVGDYTIQVRAKGATAGSFEALGGLDATVSDPAGLEKKANVVDLTINTAYLNSYAEARRPNRIEASVDANASDKDLLYKFTVQNDATGLSTIQDYSANQHCVWMPRKPGKYTVSVLVKSSASFGKHDQLKSFEITVQ